MDSSVQLMTWFPFRFEVLRRVLKDFSSSGCTLRLLATGVGIVQLFPRVGINQIHVHSLLSTSSNYKFFPPFVQFLVYCTWHPISQTHCNCVDCNYLVHLPSFVAKYGYGDVHCHSTHSHKKLKETPAYKIYSKHQRNEVNLLI